MTPDQIFRLYTAADAGDGLKQMADIVMSALNVDNAGLWIIERGAITDLTVTDDIAASTLPYLSYYASLDPWSRHPKTPNSVYLGTDFISESELRRTEFYNDFARHYGMLRPMGVVMDLAPGVVATAAINRASRMHLLDTPDKERLQAISLHLRGALTLRQRFNTTRGLAHALERTLDAVSFGCVVCAADGAVRYHNAAAAELAGRQSGIVIGGRATGLAAATAPETRRLRGLIDAAAREGRPGAMRLTGANAAGLSVLVTPLPAGAQGAVASGALVTLKEDGAVAGPSTETLQRLFGLSPAQALLCAQLARGLTFEAAAAERGIALSTARTHFLAVLKRTGAENLRDLLRLLGSLPPLLR